MKLKEKSEEKLFEKIKDFNNIGYDKWYWLNIWTQLYLNDLEGKQRIRKYQTLLEAINDIEENKRKKFIIILLMILGVVSGLEYLMQTRTFLITLLIGIALITALIWQGSLLYKFYERYADIQYCKTKMGIFWLERDSISMQELRVVRKQLKTYSRETLENILLFSYKRQRTIFIWLNSLVIFFIKPLGFIISLLSLNIIIPETVKTYLLEAIDRLGFGLSISIFFLIVIVGLLLLAYMLMLEGISRRGKLAEVTELLPQLIEKELENRKVYNVVTRKRRYR